MKLSKKGRYAVTAMMDLAFQSAKGPVTLTSISVGQEISMSYMEQLFARLRKAGLVKGTRGPGGGYRLSRAPGQITIAEILKAVDDSIEAINSSKSEAVDLNDLSHVLWNQLSSRIFSFLDNITLADLLEGTEIGDAIAAAIGTSSRALQQSRRADTITND